MGFIQKIFGGIFALIGGIFGAIAKVFGLGKQSEFYMELDEDAAPASAPAAATAPKAAPAKAEKTEVPAPTPAPKAAPTPAPQPTPAAPQLTLTFATDFLVNPKLNTTSRRRPGPSLSMFKDMARTVKTPSAG